MAIAFGSAATTDVNSTTPTLTLPSGVTEGDLLLAWIVGDVSTITVSSAPSGWTAVTGTPSDAGDGDCRGWCYYKVAGASESNPQWTFSAAASGAGAIVRYTGVDGTTPIETQSKNGTTATTSHATGNVTPTSNGSMIVGFGGTDESSAATTWTAPTNWTERVDFADTHGEWLGITVADFLQTTAAQIGGTFTSSLSDSGAMFIVALKPASSGTTITLGRPTETDAAQAVARSKTRTTGLASETDTPQAVARRKTKGTGLAAETDTAYAITRVKTRVLGQGAETDTAYAVTVRGSNVPVGHVSETDTAHGITRVKTRTLGAPTEADTPQVVGRAKVKTLGSATSGNTAQAITRVKTRTLGLVTSTQVAQALARFKAKVLGRPTETDTALPIAPPGGGLGKPTETDTAHGITRVKTRMLGAVTETDAAAPVLRVKTRTLGHATTTTAVLAVTRVKARTLGVVATTATPYTVARLKLKPLSTATETDTAHQIVEAGTATANYYHSSAGVGRAGGAGVGRAGSATVNSSGGAELP
jgi:hypothetical protein